MSNKNLYLVGTVHVDLDGRKRLDIILDKLSPSIIALEFHKDEEDLGAWTRTPKETQRIANEIIDESCLNLSPEQRATFIECMNRMNDVSVYEFKSSRNYTQKNSGSRLEYIDIPTTLEGGEKEFVEVCLEAAKENFKQRMKIPEAVQSLIKILDGGIDNYLSHVREDIQRTYQDAEERGKEYERMKDPEIFKRRTKHMSPKAIKALEQVYNSKRDETMRRKIRKLYDGKSKLIAIVGLSHLRGLAENLKDLEPRAMTLADYNHF